MLGTRRSRYLHTHDLSYHHQYKHVSSVISSLPERGRIPNCETQSLPPVVFVCAYGYPTEEAQKGNIIKKLTKENQIALEPTVWGKQWKIRAHARPRQVLPSSWWSLVLPPTREPLRSANNIIKAIQKGEAVAWDVICDRAMMSR